MTTPQPAALPEFIRVLVRVQGGESHSAEAQFMSDDIGYLVCVPREWQPAALQAQPAAAGVSDAEWWHDVLGLAGPDLLNLAKQWSDNEVHVYQFVNEAEKIVKAAAQRAILALRPQAVPMTEHERGNQVMEHLGPAALTGGRMSVLDAFNLGIDAAEAHHGITAQGAQGGEG